MFYEVRMVIGLLQVTIVTYPPQFVED